MNLTDQHLGFETVHLRVEVRRDPRLEVLRLTYIDNGVVLIVELVAAGLVRQSSDNALLKDSNKKEMNIVYR